MHSLPTVKGTKLYTNKNAVMMRELSNGFMCKYVFIVKKNRLYSKKNRLL